MPHRFVPTMFDNGKAKISVLDGIPLIEVYHSGEMELSDIAWINHVIRHELTPTPKLPVDIIIDRKGNYSLSVEVVTQMAELMQDASRVAYVVYSSTQEKMVQFARDLYLSDKQVLCFHSTSEACAWLNGNPSPAAP